MLICYHLANLFKHLFSSSYSMWGNFPLCISSRGPSNPVYGLIQRQLCVTDGTTNYQSRNLFWNSRKYLFLSRSLGLCQSIIQRFICELLKVFGAGPSIGTLFLGSTVGPGSCGSTGRSLPATVAAKLDALKGSPVFDNALTPSLPDLLVRAGAPWGAAAFTGFPSWGATLATVSSENFHWQSLHLKRQCLIKTSLLQRPLPDVIIMIEICVETAWYHDWPEYESGLRRLSTGWNREADKHLHCCCTSTKYKYTCSQAQRYTSTTKHHYIAKDKCMLYIATELCSPSLHCVDKQPDQLLPQLTNSTLQTISLRQNWANARLRGPIITCYLLPRIFQCLIVNFLISSPILVNAREPFPLANKSNCCSQ